MTAFDPLLGNLVVSSASYNGTAVDTSAGDLSTTHPLYQCHRYKWKQMRDTYEGQARVKSEGQCYLPATSGMIEDGMEMNGRGTYAYRAYILRALFHNFIADSVNTLLGMAWCKPPTYEIPTQLEYLLHKATNEGEGLNQLLRSINRQQLITGRCGLLVDLPQSGTSDVPQPYLSMYHAEKILNWDAGFRGEVDVETANLVVLDECGPKRNGIFGWQNVNQYRVLVLGDPDLNETSGTYKFGVFSAGDTAPAFDPALLKEATRRGVPFTRIPWSFINANSTVSTPCDPPLLGLSDLSLAIYRLEADYRQLLFMQTQDTLFTKGWVDGAPDSPGKALRTGAGARIHANQKEADAKYIGVNSIGLPELRTARDNDLKMAASKAGELMDASSRARESGTALEMRIGSKTSTLTEIAISGAAGLQQSLRDVGRWIGLKDSEIEKIIVKPNFEFSSREFNAMDLKAIIESKMLGAPLSLESIHKYSQARGGPGVDLSFSQMLEQIQSEEEYASLFAPKITPEQQAQLDIEQQQVDAQAQAAQNQANQPKPSGFVK